MPLFGRAKRDAQFMKQFVRISERPWGLSRPSRWALARPPAHPVTTWGRQLPFWIGDWSALAASSLHLRLCHVRKPVSVLGPHPTLCCVGCCFVRTDWLTDPHSYQWQIGALERNLHLTCAGRMVNFNKVFPHFPTEQSNGQGTLFGRGGFLGASQQPFSRILDFPSLSHRPHLMPGLYQGSIGKGGWEDGLPTACWARRGLCGTAADEIHTQTDEPLATTGPPTPPRTSNHLHPHTRTYAHTHDPRSDEC